MKFITKSNTIDAIQFNGTYKFLEEFERNYPTNRVTSVCYNKDRNTAWNMKVDGLNVRQSDWIYLQNCKIIVISDSEIKKLYDKID